MGPASRIFFLAAFSLFSTSHAVAKEVTRPSATGSDVCAIEPGAIVSDACASYSTLDSLNAELTPKLKDITQTTDFFAYYRLNLFNRVCPFWSDSNSMCGNIACAVNTLENEADIPEIWRAEELSKLEGPKAGHPGRRQQRERQGRPLQGQLGDDVGESCVVEYDDECDERDYCVPEDESAAGKGDYVSLVENPERFTGYSGPGPRQVWDAIYRENCFSKGPTAEDADKSTQASPLVGEASSALKSVIRQHGRQQALARNPPLGLDEDAPDLDDECLEKRVFYRIISGMHASISAHVCWDHLNQTTGAWGPNLQCYEEKLLRHPERISNLYFNYALVLRAVTKLRSHLERYTFCSGDASQDRLTKQKVLAMVDEAASGPAIFDESQMFKDPSATGLKQDFRNRFRNVSRLMDCVGCDKCRLWGKLQTAGYGTALKVLFEFDEQAEVEKSDMLRRTELVALVNTLDRISSSLTALSNFRQMMPSRTKGNAPNRVGEYPEDTKEEEEVEGEEDESISKAFWDEWYRVWRTFAYVLRSWYNFPGVIFKILVFEAARAWDFYLGLPVRPRTWQMVRPSRDEL
ncbi:MAG: endoplasmic oxidoreductin-1 [Thelocarpon impressellum]|nr:MAG: endoplasmic oxidoreductin-1 [Thelocarpon impressellum]